MPNDQLTNRGLYQDYANVTKQHCKASSPSKTGPYFPEKLHFLLSEMEKDGLQHIASWQPHGRCFIIRDEKLFKEKFLHA
jgi:hypothetical protein